MSATPLAVPPANQLVVPALPYKAPPVVAPWPKKAPPALPRGTPSSSNNSVDPSSAITSATSVDSSSAIIGWPARLHDFRHDPLLQSTDAKERRLARMNSSNEYLRPYGHTSSRAAQEGVCSAALDIIMRRNHANFLASYLNTFHEWLYNNDLPTTCTLGCLCIALHLKHETDIYRDLWNSWWQERSYRIDLDMEIMRESRLDESYESEDDGGFSFYIDSDGNWHDSPPSSP